MDLKHIYQDQLLKQFERLIHKTMSRVGLSQSNPYYQDYCQELRLKLLTLADEYSGDILGKDRYKFTSYAGRGLRWHLLNLLAKTNKRRDREDLTDGSEFDREWVDLHSVDIALKEAISKLDSSERELINLLNYGLSYREISDYLGLHLSTVYRRVGRIGDKIKNF